MDAVNVSLTRISELHCGVQRGLIFSFVGFGLLAPEACVTVITAPRLVFEITLKAVYTGSTRAH